MRNRLRQALDILVLAATTTSISHAAEWKIDPRIDLRAGYNDNIRLSTDDELSSPEIDLGVGSLFSYATPTSGISGDLDLEARRYTDESDLNDEIGRLRFASFRKMERSRLGFNVDLVKDTTLDSQLEETGVVFQRVNRWRYSLNPTWAYSLSERTSMELGYTYTDVNYDNNNNSNFSDYTTNGGQVSLSRILTPRATGSMTASYTQTKERQ